MGSARPGSSHPVDALAPNAFGLHQVVGSVAEWRWDARGCRVSARDMESPSTAGTIYGFRTVLP